MLVIILVAGFIAGTMIRTQLPTLPMVARFPLALSGGAGFGGDITRHLIALSPDGTRLVYVANGQLNLREMDQLNEVPIRGTDAGLSPFFSPDGQWVGFWANGSLKKVAVTGGAPVVLCNLDVPPYGVSWGANDTIVVGQGAGGILRVSSNGGPPEIIIPMEPERNERGHGPQILPDGNTVLFTVTTTASWDEAQIVVESLETGERKLLIAGGTDARYVSTGHIVYALGNTLLAVPFDLRRLEVLGGPVPVIESVRRTLGSPTGAVQAAFSDSGSLAYVSGGDPELGLVWVDRQGAETPLSGPPLSYRFPRLSPDGTRLAVIGNGDVWIHDIVRGTWTRLTFTENNDNLVWTADGERVVFSSSRAGAQNLFWKSVDGSDEATQLTEGESAKHPDSLSPDGRHLAFHEHSSANGTDLWILSLEGDFEARPFLRTPYNERVATFSPNGRWLAYVSDSSGVNEIYAQPFPGPGGTNVVSPNGGLSPVWHRTGRELFYRMSSEMMVVDIATESGFVAGTPRPLFRKDRDSSGPQVHYDVTPSGERFVMSLPEQEARAAEIVVVLNWLEELKRLVPVD